MKTKKLEQYRQGDVLIERVFDSALKDDAMEDIPREDGRIVLAHGEATGHAHAISDKNAFFFEGPGRKERFLRVLKGGVALRHEEHREVKIPAGLYRITRQREYSPEAIRNVAD